MSHLKTPLSYRSTEQLERWLAGPDAADYPETARGIRVELAGRRLADDDQRRTEEGDDQRDYAEERDVSAPVAREAAGGLVAELGEMAAIEAADLVCRVRGVDFRGEVIEALDRAEELYRTIDRRAPGDFAIGRGAHRAVRGYLKDAYNALCRARQEMDEALSGSEAPVGP